MLQRSNSFKRKVAQRARKDSATVPGGVVFKNAEGAVVVGTSAEAAVERAKSEQGAGVSFAVHVLREGRPSAKSLFGRGGGAGAPAWEARHAVLDGGCLAMYMSAKEITSFRGWPSELLPSLVGLEIDVLAGESFRGRPNCVHLEGAGAIGLVNSTRSLAEGNAPGLRGHAPPAAFTLSFASKAEAAAWADAARAQRDGGACSPEKLAAQHAALEEAKASAAAAAEALAAQRAAASDAAAGVAARLREVDAEIEAAWARKRTAEARAAAARAAAAAEAARARAELNEIEAAMERAVDEVGVPGGGGGTDGGSWLEEVRKRRAAAAS